MSDRLNFADRLRMGKEIERLQAENAKLREELAKWERLTDGIDLPEYPIVQFEPKDLERENAKLRELAEDMLDCIEIRSAFGRPPTSEMCENFAQRAGELGIEV